MNVTIYEGDQAMPPVQINVSNDLISQVGTKEIESRLEHYLENIRMQMLIDKIKAAIDQHGIEHEKMKR